MSATEGHDCEQTVRSAACARYGHSHTAVEEVGNPDPVGFVCTDCGATWGVRAATDVSALQVAYAIGRALGRDESEEYWRLIAELDRALPDISWHNLATDSPCRAAG